MRDKNLHTTELLDLHVKNVAGLSMPWLHQFKYSVTRKIRKLIKDIFMPETAKKNVAQFSISNLSPSIIINTEDEIWTY